MDTLKNKHIWIIGASSGIGKSLSQKLADAGATLILSARNEDDLHKTKQSMSGDDHIVAPLDVSNIDEIESAFKKVRESVKKIDSIIFMAAIFEPHSAERAPLDFVEKAYNVNVIGAYRVVDVVQDFFIDQGHGQLVFCSSVAGYRGLPYGQPYCSTKAALTNYAESLKVELEDYNIDIKIINPGFVKTRMTDKNDFKMPMMISSGEAATGIINGLTSQSFEIHFPKKFTYIMKIIRLLPSSLYFLLSRRMKREQS